MSDPATPITQSALERALVSLGLESGQVVMLHASAKAVGRVMGGPDVILKALLDTITLLHYAEARARLRHKRVIHYQCPMLVDGKRVWIDVEDWNTGEPHDDYSFEQIALAHLDQKGARQGKVGNADSYLLDAADLAAFAIDWLEERFGEQPGQSSSQAK